MVAGMTGSGKTVWVQSLLQQAQTVIYQPPERIIWCYSQWQPAYTQLLMIIPTIKFVKGDPGISGKLFLFRCQYTQPDCH